tara:strand:- start:192 stop:323 length:132 start_codon:yes stop_codon:yes gene_type:complete
LKTFSIFVLLIYWSIIILAPVVSKETLDIENKKKIFPLKKPIN